MQAGVFEQKVGGLDAYIALNGTASFHRHKDTLVTALA